MTQNDETVGYKSFYTESLFNPNNFFVYHDYTEEGAKKRANRDYGKEQFVIREATENDLKKYQEMVLAKAEARLAKCMILAEEQDLL